MKKKIIFQKCHFNYIYFLIYMLTFIIIKIIDHFLEMSGKDGKVPDNFYFYIFGDILEIYTFNLADFFAIIPHFIRKKLSKANNEKKEEKNIEDEISENKTKTELIYNESSQKGTILKSKTILFYLFLIAAFDFLKTFMLVLFYFCFPEKKYVLLPFNHSVIFEIIIQFIFSKLILKIHFYKLQYFSLYLNVVIFIFILALDLLDILKFNVGEGSIYIFVPFLLIFYCLKSVCGKKVILHGYISVYLLIIIKGAIKLIFVIIFSLIAFIIDKKVFSIFVFYFSELKYILLIIGKIISNFFNELSIWIILDRFSPNHTPLIIIGEELYHFVVDLTVDNSKFNKMGLHKIVRIFLYVFSFIGVILHNEIVVINICGLGSDTKYFLDIIEKDDQEYISSDDPDTLKRFETIEEIDNQEEDDSVSNGCEKSYKN